MKIWPYLYVFVAVMEGQLFFFLDKALSNACIYQNNLLHNNLQL